MPYENISAEITPAQYDAMVVKLNDGPHQPLPSPPWQNHPLPTRRKPPGFPRKFGPCHPKPHPGDYVY